MTSTDLYYDPFDFDIDDDPHPVWKRMRNEAPLYRNDKYGFYALSRYEDVARELSNWQDYRSGLGTTLDLIMSNVEFPPGAILCEDPPAHDHHRRVVSRIFTPRRMEAIEPLTRDFCVRALDPLAGTGKFDFVQDIGATVPMRTIGYLLGIPEDNQEEIRDRGGHRLNLDDGAFRRVADDFMTHSYALFADYIDWRMENPSDDLMTQLLTSEVEDENGTRPLSREEVLTYAAGLAGAANETTTRLIGFMGQLLAEHPDQRREIVADPTLIPRAIEEILRYEAPSPVQARYVARDVACHGTLVPEGSIMLLVNGSANRDERKYDDADKFDIHRGAAHLSFGHGLHFCLGSALARMQAKVVLQEVIRRWPDWEIDYANATRARTSSVRGWSTMPVFTN